MAWTIIGPVSRESRLNRIYPQIYQFGHVPFVWRIQSDFPFYIATGSSVEVRSSITEVIY